jgi:hypothetical protein
MCARHEQQSRFLTRRFAAFRDHSLFWARLKVKVLL